MQVENHKEEVPFEHYREKFAALNPEEAAERLGVRFANGEFTVRLLGVTYRLAHPDFAVRADTDGIALHSLPAQTLCGIFWRGSGRLLRRTSKPSAKCLGESCTFSPSPGGF